MIERRGMIHALRVCVVGEPARHWQPLRRSKIFEKTEKKTCHPFGHPLNLTPKPNQNMEKPMIRQLLKSLGSRRLVLVAGVAMPFLLGSSAFAQQPAASPGTQLPENGPGPAAPPAPASQGEASTERVVVTGSYIPTAEEVTASPLDTLTSQEVRRAGTSDVLQVLQKRNPDFVGGGNIGSTNANISSGNTLGGSIVQIRGFPSLVLYEGRRISDAAALAVGGAQFTDIGLFPAALLSRI